jgi:hypothetical protein
MTRRAADRRADPATEFKRSWTLDMIVPLDEEEEADGGGLLSRWSDLAVEDLSPSVQEVALADPRSWRTIAEALIDPAVVAIACDAFVAGIRRELVARYGERDATITVVRAGLLADEVPTLEQVGRDWDLTRERVRQLVRGITVEAKAALDWRAPLRLAIGAWITLHRGTPLVVDDFAAPDTAHGRAVTLAFSVMELPQSAVPAAVWTRTPAQCRAVDALVDALPELIVGARSFAELEARAADSLPHVEEVLDLESTLRLLAERLDFGPALDGRFTFGYTGLAHRVAGKIVTYLQRRAAPIMPTDLAQAVRKGVPPFEPFHRPLIEPEWLVDCARRNPTLLQLQPDGRVALARRLGHLRPTGNVGILHSIVVDHGEPMRMIDLCDHAAQFGISRNQVGVFIHSGRAASLFMLDRGIVGLVGRDEGADPSEYEAARPGATPRVRVGEEIGFDREGPIAADVEVRRSIREQGFGLPWPFSVIYFSDRPELLVDGEPVTIILRGNGDLELPQLEPGSRVRLRLAVTKNGHRLSIESTGAGTIAPVRDIWNGAHVPVGLPLSDDRPGWIDFVLTKAGPKVGVLDEVVGLMPRTMASKRRLRALYAFVALGLLQPGKSGWTCRRDRQLPAEVVTAFAAVTDDPSCYAVLTREEQAAIGWLVWATWVVPNLGWSRVRPNDLADAGAEDEAALAVTPAATSPRETALMRIVEAAHQADDLRRHPGATDGIEATSKVVRRYLTALGYTAYNAIRELNGAAGDRTLSVHPASDAGASAIWMLRPIGAGISKSDISRARKLARTESVTVAVATDGLHLVAVENGAVLDIDLRDIGRNQGQFDRLRSLAVDPSLFEAAE